ncbi:MAG: glycoside hydrolase [Acidobacteria bacterium RBG_13_68_16]|nr:MAG: glycoside hydrolase [Acidobacteria bacterium RBG_13_68_16]
MTRKIPFAVTLAVVSLLSVLPVWVVAAGGGGSTSDDPWARLPGILARIQPPVFPARDFSITDFGGVGDGSTDATSALMAAIEACHASGGGRVIVPPGEFLTGPVRLLSNVNLHILAGGTLRFSADPARYLPVVFTRWEGVELMNYAPLVYAFEQKNLAITGSGTLDGQADPLHWWPWKAAAGAESQKPARTRLFQQAAEGVPPEQRVYGAGHYLRPPFLQVYRCRNVLVEGVTIRNSPFWVIHPVLSSNVIVRRVSVVSPGPNNDGCDPESSTDVLIEDTLFDTGDDCIAIKSGRNADGRRLAAPSERIVVRNCRMRAGHGGVTVGSEVSGGVRDVFAECNTMSSPDLERGLRIKTNTARGGFVENVFMRDTEIGEVGSAIDIDMLYQVMDEDLSRTFIPVVRNVRVEGLTVGRAAVAFSILGLEVSPVGGVVIRDSVFRNVSRGSRLANAGRVVLENVTLDLAPVPAPSPPQAPVTRLTPR